MKIPIRIFDDVLSFFHVIIGFYFWLWPPLMIIFIAYQILEEAILQDNDYSDMLGDLIEFLIGIIIGYFWS